MLNTSAIFSGSNTLNIANYTGNPSAFSVSCWINLAATQVSRIFFADFLGAGSKGWAVGISDSVNNQIKFYLGSATLAQSGALTNGVWAHAIFTHDGTTAKIYLNGNTTPNASTATAVVYGTVPANNYIGSLDGTNQKLNGSLAGVGYWSKALSTTEVTSLYNSGNGLRYSELSGSLLTSLGSYHDFLNSGSLGADGSGAQNYTNTGTVTWAGTGPAGAVYQLNGPFLAAPKRLVPQRLWNQSIVTALDAPSINGSTVGAYDPVLGGNRSYVGTPAWAIGTWGNEWLSGDSSNAGISFGTPIAAGSANFTLAALCTLNTTTGGGAGNRHLWSCESGNNANMRLVLNSGLLQFQLGADGAFTNLTTSPQFLNVPVLVTCRCQPGGIRSIWYGAYKQNERTDATAAWGANASTTLALGTSADNTTRVWSGRITAGYIWNRALTDAEIVALAADPWAPVRPGRMQLSALARGAGILGVPRQAMHQFRQRRA